MQASQRWGTAVVLGLAAVVLTVTASWTWWSVVDDAYISARYAAVWANGGGLAFSPDETPVEGYTNLLFTLTIGVALALGLPPLGTLVGLGYAAGLATLAAMTAATRALSGQRGPVTALPALAWALLPHAGVVTTNGLETTMMTAAVCAAIAAWSSPTATATTRAAASTLLVLVRPEGAAVVALLAAPAVGSAPRAHWRALSAPATTVVLLEVWRWETYGAFVPNTWSAKASFPLSETFTRNANYFGPETASLSTLAVVGVLGVVLGPHRLDRWGPRAVWLLLALLPLTVEEWMPGLRLFQPAWTVGLVLAGAGVLRWRWGPWAAGALPIATLALAVTQGEAVRTYDAHHTVAPGNGAELAARHLARRLPAAAWVATRDAGNFAFWVGPEVKIAELHQRALTLPHPEGADLDVLATTPTNPEVLVTTVRTATDDKVLYPGDRRVFARLDEPYAYLGRVQQHHRRHYDIYVRQDLDVAPLPAEIVVGFPGPSPGGNRRGATAEPMAQKSEESP